MKDKNKVFSELLMNSDKMKSFNDALCDTLKLWDKKEDKYVSEAITKDFIEIYYIKINKKADEILSMLEGHGLTLSQKIEIIRLAKHKLSELREDYILGHA